MPRNFEIRRTGKNGLPLAVGEQRDDGTVTMVLAGNGQDFATLADAEAACASLSSTGVEVVWT